MNDSPHLRKPSDFDKDRSNALLVMIYVSDLRNWIILWIATSRSPIFTFHGQSSRTGFMGTEHFEEKQPTFVPLC